ncbi:Monoterpene epsilon-lactone hydrolase [Paenibacillus auburnensis]|uniref:Monoterpene epsilon-lactone hydrolase n=1 Tax=Paenibacillus auburnensis TaxID=2905649 RepID=A0ABN8FYQ8_9BACL|nr:alpha/beta hydrolase [Paenibacillus auburnensis]CAH1191369.1 Monoterpene epsilon-lactone hydrolase [Paenibacillus auburnensis]
MPTPIHQLEAIKRFLRQNRGPSGKSIEQIRNEMAEAARQLPRCPDIKAESVNIGELYGEWVSIEGMTDVAAERAFLYFHGGGFIAGTCEMYRDLAARISGACGIKVLTFQYRLAPEHRYPAANEDCLSAFYWLLGQGFLPENIFLGGDSVGATLALMTLISLRDAGEAMPAAAVLLSPHSDLVHLDGESYTSRAMTDPTGSLEGNRKIVEDYVGGCEGGLPALLSPLRLDLHGLPPILIQAGDQEVLLSDAERLAVQLRTAGSEVKLEIWEQMWSVFQFMAGLLVEGEQAIVSIGEFVRTVSAAASGTARR